MHLADDYVLDPFSERVVDARAVDFGAVIRDVVFDPDLPRAARLGINQHLPLLCPFRCWQPDSCPGEECWGGASEVVC